MVKKMLWWSFMHLGVDTVKLWNLSMLLWLLNWRRKMWDLVFNEWTQSKEIKTIYSLNSFQTLPNLNTQEETVKILIEGLFIQYILDKNPIAKQAFNDLKKQTTDRINQSNTSQKKTKTEYWFTEFFVLDNYVIQDLLENKSSKTTDLLKPIDTFVFQETKGKFKRIPPSVAPCSFRWASQTAAFFGAFTSSTMMPSLSRLLIVYC